MSTMSQPIQSADDIVPLSDPRPIARSNRTPDLSRLKTPLRLLAGLLLSPVLLLVGIFGFLVVLSDFAFFRLRDLRHGHPHPKGLWEF